ncbi:MAG TPA: 2Fe-2S iron-sulfur cluster-binding protein, partial [Salinivirgaceae bacterium]|nr:2Fe-2S iron-sulfur cluster-binding protein [Salinivirgaceae bacterium]
MFLQISSSVIIVTGTVVFLLVILLLVILLLYAKMKLTPQGKVKIIINEGEKELEVDPGSSLLTTLANNKIFLPSACGGGGTCAMCRCQIFDG